MTREILFKAKRKDNGEWVEGYLMDENYINVPFDDYDACGRFDDLVEIAPDTICQYTGLTDKNGQKIYENDILKAHLDADYPEDTTYTRILWNETGFCSNENHSRDIETFEKWDAEHFEVCGNIFDNPGLLEVE